ncbi:MULTISPECIES: alpha/beta fold hydrolase [unclassified Peribacillus]|uniref:alpha/beta fold hydrolase n=1 Tax=unclassified Peribacillus TaxID=2675266 RepID=UPI001E2D9B16|nr:alpha/beta hydrolase [Peribacillus sp. Bi96]
MSTFTIPTVSSYIEAEGIRFAYRKFGKETGIPLIFFIHFRGTMENWDPEMIGALAENRPIILFDNTGVGETSGETPTTISEMAKDAATFIKALGLEQVDILGFSIGGFVAQELVLQQPNLVRRIVLAGTAPQSGVNDARKDVHEAMTQGDRDANDALETFLFLFYSPTETSRAAGVSSLKRIFTQKKVESSLQVRDAQLQAIAQWGDRVHEQKYDWLQKVTQPVLVTNGVQDIMVPTENSYILVQHLPNAQLIIYPDSGHGHLFQYPELFAAHVKMFLDV